MMTVVLVLAVWGILSVVVGLLLGPVLARASEGPEDE
jgi:uncharacterized protein YneF (UPF0154 family)